MPLLAMLLLAAARGHASEPPALKLDGVHAWPLGVSVTNRERLAPGYYLLVSEVPFSFGSGESASAAEWRMGRHVLAFHEDGRGAEERLELRPRARADEPGRYEFYRSSAPFQIAAISPSDSSCGPVRPALADPPCSSELAAQVVRMSVGPAAGPVAVSWELRGDGESPAVPADFDCEEARAEKGALRGSWTMPERGELGLRCRATDRRAGSARSGFRFRLVSASGAVLPREGSLLARDYSGAIQNR